MENKVPIMDFGRGVMRAEEPVLVDFYADWCMPCKMLAQVIEEVAEEATGTKVMKVNIDEEPELASKFQIMSIPTLVVMKDGEVVDKSTGVRAKEDILSMLALSHKA